MSESKKEQLNVFSASFKEGVDFYYNDEGLMVLTEKYLLKRGHCCHSDCVHCPYKEDEKGDASIPFELRGESSVEEDETWHEYYDYDPDEES